MINHYSGSISALAALVFSLLILPQTAQYSGTAKAQAPRPTPDLSGVWLRASPQVWYTFTKDPAPMQPWAEYRYKYHRTPEDVDRNGEGRQEHDPRYLCMPPGPTALMNIGRPAIFEIVQSPRRVLLFHEWDHWVRQIWTDGRELPEDPDPMWMGYSVGRWEGDTLVVDTIGINERTWLDSAGTPHSDALHVVERFRRVDRDTLEVEFLFNDPKAFTKPWTAKKVYKLQPDTEIQEHLACEDLLLRKGSF